MDTNIPINAKKLIAAVLIASLIPLISPLPVSAFNQQAAIDYLKSGIIEEWKVMALSAAGELSGINVSFLNQDPGVKPLDIEKRILAQMSAGQNPSANIQRLVTNFNGTEIDSSVDPDILNDDIFGLLALSAANTRLDVRNSLASFIKANQNSDGGFSHFKSPSPSNSDATSMVIMALLAHGESPSSATINQAFSFLESTNTGNGFSHFAGGEPNEFSTPWVISAYLAVRRPVPAGAQEFVDSLQRANGSFGNSALLTTYAVIALDAKFYPVTGSDPGNVGGNGDGNGENNGGSDETVTIPVTIVGPVGNIFSGQTSYSQFTFQTSNVGNLSINNPAALGTLIVAAEQAGFSYIITNQSAGLFVESIAGFGTKSGQGWLYAVNGTKPNSSAAEYILGDDDEVIWFYGAANDPVPEPDPGVTVSDSVDLSIDIDNPNSNPNGGGGGGSSSTPTISLSSNQTSISLGQTVTLSWSSSNATVVTGSTPENWAGGQVSGTRTVQPQETTTYTINVQGPGGISTQSITVTVNSTPDIVFGLETEPLNFGQVRTGRVSQSRSMRLINSSNVDLHITTSLMDADPVYEQGLFIGNVRATEYETTLGAGFSKRLHLNIAVPSNYSGSGTKTGRLVFWATPR